MKAKTKIKRLLGILLALSMVVGMLPTVALAEESATKTETADFSADPTMALAAEGTPDCYIEGSDGSYTGYNWMGADPAVGDRDVYVHIVGNVPDGWTMVGGMWTGADYIDITANPLLSKADCGDQFTKSLTQTGKVSVGKNVSNRDVTIYRLTVDDDGTLEAGEYRIFFESTDTYYVPAYYNLSIPDPASSEKHYNSIGDMELPQEISTGTTSVSFICTVNLYGENPNDATFELREGSVNGNPVGSVSGSDLTKSQRTGGYYEFRGTMPVSGLTGGTELYLSFSHDKFNEAEWYMGPTTYVVPDGGAGQFILYGAEKDTTDDAGYERRHSTYEKAVPGATYHLTNNGDTTHTFVISGSSLSDVSRLSVTGGSLVADSLRVSMKNGVYTVTGGVTVSASASALSFSYDGKELHSINFDRTTLAGVTTPYVTSAELVQVFDNGDFTVKLSGFNLGSDAAGYSGVNYSGEKTYDCESFTERNGIYTLRFTPSGIFSNDSVYLWYNGESLKTPDKYSSDGGTVPVNFWLDYPNLADFYVPDGVTEYVGAVKGNQTLTIMGVGFDSSNSYTACFVPHTSEGFDIVKTAACTYVSEKELTVNAASVGTGWFTMYITADGKVLPRFQDIALYEDISGPQLPVITINGGKGVTTSQTIALSIDGGDYTEVRVAESTAELASAEWQAADSLTSYTLSEGYGEKTLYFEFRTAENETYSETARVTYSDSVLSGAEYGISGAADGNKVYIGNKYTLFIKYTGTGYVKGQAAISDGTGNVSKTIELRRVSTVGTTATYTGKTNFAATDKQIVFSLLDANGNAASVDPISVTVAEDLVISAANSPRLPRGSYYNTSNKISYTANYTLEFNGTPGKTATAVFAFDAGDSVTVTLPETEGKPGHYLFDGPVNFPAEATKLQSITYRLEGSIPNAAEKQFTVDEYGTAYTEFVLSPTLKITNIPPVYQSRNAYLEITSQDSESGFKDFQTITGANATFKYLNRGTTYVCKLVMDGIVMRSWEVTMDGDTTFDYKNGEPVGNVDIAMNITPPGDAAASNDRYVSCVYVAADGTNYQFSLPCNGTKTLPKQGTLTYEVNMSSGEKLTYCPIAGTVDLATLSADSHTITATTVERNYHEITGTVTSMLDKSDTNEKAVPLSGAEVQVTQILTDDAYIVNRTMTDIEGNYSLRVCKDSPVTITFSRYDHKDIQKTVEANTDADAEAWDATLQYGKQNLIIPKLVVKPIEDPELAADEALQPMEIMTDWLELKEVKADDPDAFYYWNTVLEHNNMFRSAVALSPSLEGKDFAYPNKSLTLQFALNDERFVLDNNGVITVETDANSTAFAELTATYKGYMRIDALEESNTVYMLVFDKAKYDEGADDACVGMAYGNGMVTTQDLKLDAGEYKVFVFKGNSLATSISTLESAPLLKQYLKEGILHTDNCTEMYAVVENGKITPLKNAIPAKALTGDALCSMRFVTKQTESGDLRVKFYIDKLPEGKTFYGMELEQKISPVNPANPEEELKGITYYDYSNLPISGEFYLGRDPYNNKAEGTLSVNYEDMSDHSVYTITFKFSETLPASHISLEMSPIFSTEEGKIDISGKTEPNTNVALQIGGLEAGQVQSDSHGRYTATLRVSGAENGSIYPITASVDVGDKKWTAQGRTTASKDKIEVLNIETRHHNTFTKQDSVVNIDNLYSHNQAQSQSMTYYPAAPTTVSFQLTGCKREAFDSVYLITYDEYGNEDKTLKANCTGYDDGKFTSEWVVEGNLSYFSSMGIRYFFNPEYIEDDPYELLTGNEPADLSGLLNAAANEDPTENTINLAEAPNVIRQHVDFSNFMISGLGKSRTAPASFAYTRTLSDEGDDGEATDIFAYTHNLGGEGKDAGKLNAEVSMAAPMTETDLKEAGYLKMDTKQGSVWIKQEVDDSSKDSDGEVTYTRSMYFSPEISKAAGITTDETSPVTTYSARGGTDRALEGIDFLGNLQGGADFFHSLNKEMAEQFKNTTLGSESVGTGIAILGAAGTVVKIASGPSSQSPEKLLQMVKLIKNPDKRKVLMHEIQEYIKLSDDLYYTDCIGSSLLSGVGFVSNLTPVTKGATLFGGIAFGVVNTWTGDELKSMYASIENSILSVLQSEKNKIGKDVKLPDFKLLIDPSGYVFEAVEDNRVEGVTATVFEVDVSNGSSVAWTDNWAGQENPQTTGIDGRYGWDVPTGTWKVSFDKAGYQHAESKTMKVYPAHTEVNIGLLSTAIPEVTAAAIVDNELEVQFSMYMQADASSCAITVYDEDMKIVPGTVSFPKAVANTGYRDGVYQRDAIAAEKFTRWATFTPSEDYVGGFHDGETYTVKVSKNALSYAGVPMAADYTNTEVRKSETVSTLSTPTASVDSGVFKTIQTVSLTAGDGASIFYTTDGTTPNENSALYTGPITLSSNTTLKFIAIKTGYNNSPVGEKNYAIELSGMASKPTASVASGTYSDTLSVELSSTTPGAKIYYTTNGSEPTTSSAEYLSPVSISATTTLKAIAVIGGLDNSEVSTFEYRISSGNPGGGNSGGSSGGGTTRYTVSFETNGGSKVSSKTVTRNTAVSEPTAPTKDGYTFDGWYSDKALKIAYDFSAKVTKSFTLYAKWTEKATEPDKPTEPTVPEWKNPFTDVKKSDWFYTNVEYAVNNKLMNGTTATTFAPSENLTRAMLIAILYRAEGEPAVNKSIPFSDVAVNAYYANAVIWAQQNGIVNGVTENAFAPDNNITREQIAAIMFRFAKYKGYDVSVGESTNILSYTDARDVSEYAVSAMQYAVGSGLMKGKTESTINPLDNATRAEIAAILQRFIEANK